MIIYHTKQSGFVVLVDDSLSLLFDMITPKCDLPTPLIQTNRNMVFVSHGHHDHYRSRIIPEFSNAHFFVSNDLYLPNRPNITKMTPNMSAGHSGVIVSSFGSTDQGVSYIVTLPDDCSILHCGDLNWWHWDSFAPEEQEKEAATFKNIVNQMVDNNITYAFVPVDPRLGAAANWAAQYIIDTLNPMYLIPMHAWDRYDEVNTTLNELVYKNTHILHIHNQDSIVYDDTVAKNKRAIY